MTASRSSPDRLPLVAVPGLGLSADVARRTLDLLPGPSAVVELPGYGLPAGRGTPLGPVDLAHVLLTRLDQLDVARAVLLGHSASCQIVAQLAADAPDRVAALVLVGPTTDPMADGWARLAARWLRTAAWERPGQVPQLVRDYGRTRLPVMARAMDAARRHRIDRVLADVGCPVLVVRGRHDRIAPLRWAEELTALITYGRPETLRAGGHMIPLTHPAELAARIDAFLDARWPDRQLRP